MITDLDGIVNALANNSSRFILDKASLSNQQAGRMCSLWRATGQPAQGAIPTTPELCTSAMLGAMSFPNQTAPMTTYIAYAFATNSNNAATLEIHDRLAHCGGLLLNSTAVQTITGMDLSTLALPTDRRGNANYSDIQWWLEVYADGGGTAANATINVTFDDGSTGNLSVQAVGGTIRVGHMIGIDILRTTAQQGKNIRGINSVTLSVSTGTAGNFGFTATRPRTTLPLNIANKSENFDWASLGLPEIANNSCLVPLLMTATSTSGTVRGGGKLIHG